MSRLWTWPSLPHRAILAAVAILLFAAGGAAPAAGGAARMAAGFGLVQTVGASDRPLCAVVDDSTPASPALPRAHCADQCCQAARLVWTAVRIETAVAPPGEAVDAAGPRRPDESPPRRASGWESSWSSRAPPISRWS